MRVAISQALEQLWPRERLAPALRYVHELSNAEIAAALGCRGGTVDSLISARAAAQLPLPARAD